MTLLYLDGFDVGDFALKWLVNPHGPGADISTTTPFSSGRSLFFASDTVGFAGVAFSYVKRGFIPSAEVILGFNFQYVDTPVGADQSLVRLFSGDGTDLELVLKMNADGTLTLYDGSGSSLGSGPVAAMLPSVWKFIEIDAAASSAEVRVNEAVVISVSGLSAADYTAVELNHTTTGPDANLMPDMYYDDFYLCNGLDDSIGPANNTYFGIGQVQTLLPDGVGASTDLTPTGAVDNYDAVNDVPYSTADYVSGDVPGDRDTYQLDDLASATSDVKGIQTVLIGQATGGAAHAKPALRSGGTVYYDATVALDGSTAVVSAAVREVDPATGSAWSVSGVNALEAGVEIAS